MDVNDELYAPAVLPPDTQFPVATGLANHHVVHGLRKLKQKCRYRNRMMKTRENSGKTELICCKYDPHSCTQTRHLHTHMHTEHNTASVRTKQNKNS
jgi:hypothetical protein